MPHKEQSNLKDFLRNGLLCIPPSQGSVNFESKRRKKYKNFSYDKTLELLEYHIYRATKTSLKRRDSIAVELSGGLDSSCLASITREIIPDKKIYALTHTPPRSLPEWYHSLDRETKKRYNSSLHNESKWSQFVAQYLNLKQYLIDQDQDLHWIIETSSEILGTYSEVLFPLLNLPSLKLAKSLGIKTILSGFGGDEVVSQSGSLYLNELKQSNNYIKYTYERILSHSFKKGLDAPYEEDMTPYLTDEVLKTKKNIYHRPTTIKEREQRLLQGDLSFHWKRRQEISKILANHFDINYEFPLADKELIIFFHNMPSKYKFQHGKNRYLMRKLLERRLPKSIAWRKDKAGCTIPSGRFFLIHNLPKVFLERINDSYQGQLLEFLKIKKIRSRLEQGPVFDSKFLRILVAALMIAHLEKKNHEVIK